MKKIICIFAVFVCIFMLCPLTVNAENIYVCDSANVLSEATEQYIDKLNRDVLTNYSTSPRFAIMMIDKMPEDIDQYAQNVFYEYEMSKDSNSYDVLLIMAIDQKQYKIEKGGGYANGTLIEQDLTMSMIGESVLNNLQLKKYDDAIMEIAKYYEKMMKEQNDGSYAQREVKLAKRMAIFKPVVLCLGIGGIVACIASFIIEEKKKDKAVASNLDTPEQAAEIEK